VQDFRRKATKSPSLVANLLVIADSLRGGSDRSLAKSTNFDSRSHDVDRDEFTPRIEKAARTSFEKQYPIWKHEQLLIFIPLHTCSI